MSRGRDPRAMLLAFGLLVPLLMSAPFFSVVWWGGCGLVVVAGWAASLSWRFLGRGFFRLRWLWLALLLVHALMTPGEYLGSGWPPVTREGVVSGLHQVVRLMLLAVLAWSLARSTTPMALVGACAFYLGWMEGLGVPVGRWVSILGFSLTGLTRFREQAGRVRHALALRLGAVSGPGERLERLAFAGGALLSGLLWDLGRREEGLRARGLTGGIPSLQGVGMMGRPSGQGGGDWWVPVWPGMLWLAWFWR